VIHKIVFIQSFRLEKCVWPIDSGSRDFSTFFVSCFSNCNIMFFFFLDTYYNMHHESTRILEYFMNTTLYKYANDSVP